MPVYFKGEFKRVSEPITHLTFKITKIKQINTTRYDEMVGQTYAVHPNRKRCRRYVLLKTVRILGGINNIKGRILRSKKYRGWFKFYTRK